MLSPAAEENFDLSRARPVIHTRYGKVLAYDI